LPHPQKLGQSKVWKRGIAGQFNQPLGADPASQLLALILGSHVTPDQRGTHDLIVSVEHDRAMHLTGETHARQIISA